MSWAVGHVRGRDVGYAVPASCDHPGCTEIIDRGLKVADATAFSLCMDNQMPIMVFNLLTEGNIARAVAGEKIGTLVK